MQDLLSFNSILMISGGLLLLLIVFIILLARSSKRKNEEDYYDEHETTSEGTRLLLPPGANANSLFRDQNLAKLVAATLNVQATDQLSERQLLQIKRLDGTAKDIADLEGINLLRNLEIVNLGSNKLTALPGAIKDLPQLHELRVDNNEIHDITPVIGSKSLRTLDISDNGISQLSNDIFTLPNLEKFSAQRNRIEHISGEMTSAPSRIHELDLSQNGLRTIPRFIQNMSELSSLNLASNMLTDIPLALGSLENIKKLDVSDNKSLVMPDSLKQKLLSKSVDVRADSHDGQFGGIQLESFDIIDGDSDGVVKFEEIRADDGGLDDMKNTYIDLTSSNDDLLNEIAALEKHLGDTMPPHAVDSRPVEMSIAVPRMNAPMHDNSLPHRMNNVNTMGNNQPQNVLDQTNMNEGGTQPMNEVQSTEVQKKEKRKKLLKTAGIVAGATLAAVALAGTSVYMFKKGDDKRKKNRRQTGYFFTKKRR
jgi:hypothetical protein